MRKAQGISAAVFFSLILPAMACASPPNASDEQIIDCVQTVQLVPNTPTYSMWANWIHDEITRDTANYHDFRNGQFVAETIDTDLDLITIKTATQASGIGTSSANHSPATLGEKPAALPISGEPGEQITIVSQTTTTYLSWTYIWNVSADGGRGGWQLTGSAFHDCHYMTGKPSGARCERS
jgi:hypothetical protein